MSPITCTELAVAVIESRGVLIAETDEEDEEAETRVTKVDEDEEDERALGVT